ncbi:MAG: hypothetical protein ACE14W_00350 [Candidatus Velamenicoccus archaeovorus]
MLMRLKPLRRDERGVALVVSLLVVFVVLLLAGVVFAQAVHNSTRSAGARKRLQSVDAAEAGLNFFYNYLENTAAGDLTLVPLTESVAVAPGTATFTVTPTWYDDSGDEMTGPFSDTSYPSAVHLVSQGSTNGTTPRTMETYMEIHPVFGGFEGAIITTASTQFTNNFTLNGSSGNDGDIVVTCPGSSCDVTITNGLQNVHGTLYVPNGNLALSSQTHVYGDVWANGSILIDQPNAQVDGDAISSTSSVTVDAGSVAGLGTYCTTVSGSSNIAGGTVQKCQGPPPSLNFPEISYVDQVDPNADPNWDTAGNLWYVKTFTGSGTTPCTDAKNWLQGNTPGTTYNSGNGIPSIDGQSPTGVIVRIAGTCTFGLDNNRTITMNTNVAVITDGSVNLSQQSTWNGQGSTRNLFFVVPYRETTPPSCGGGTQLYDISFGNKTNFNSLVNVGVYTPGRANMSNLNVFSGQVIAGQTCIGNNWSMNYEPIVFPGQHVSSFTEDIAYIREIPNP